MTAAYAREPFVDVAEVSKDLGREPAVRLPGLVSPVQSRVPELLRPIESL